jgi:hypothetical protein
LAIAKLLAKFDAIPLLKLFRHFGRKLQCDTHCVYTLTHTLAAGDWGCLLAEKNPSMCTKVSSTSLSQHTSRASLVSAEKNYVGYFLNRLRTSCKVNEYHEIKYKIWSFYSSKNISNVSSHITWIPRSKQKGVIKWLLFLGFYD